MPKLIDVKEAGCVAVGLAAAMSLSSLVLWKSDWLASAQSNYWLHGASVLVGVVVCLVVFVWSFVAPNSLRVFLDRVFPPIMVVSLLCSSFFDAAGFASLQFLTGVMIPTAGVYLFLFSWFLHAVMQSMENGFLSILLAWVLAGLVRGAFEFVDEQMVRWAASVFLVCAMWGLSLLRAKRVGDALPMFADRPCDVKDSYVHALRSLWKCALYCGAFAFLGGIIRSLTLQAGAMAYINYASILGGLVSALVLVSIWKFRTIRYSVNYLFRGMFPFLVIALCALPFVKTGSWVVIAAALYAIYSFMSLSLQMLCAQASYDYGVNPVFCLSFQTIVTLCMQGLGYLLGTAASEFAFPDALIALVSLAVLAMVLYVTRGLSISQEEDGRVIEFLSLSRKAMWLKRVSGKVAEDAGGEGCEAEAGQADGVSEKGGVKYADRLSMRCDLIGKNAYLSLREIEIMKLVVKGFTIAAIAKELYISENTVKTHMRRLYAKLGIHKKQQLFSLVNSYVD